MDSRARSCVGNSGQRRGVTVLELIIVIGIAGVLAAIVLPAVMAARETARRTYCTANLRQLGIAIHHHHDRHRHLPSAWQLTKEDREFAYGWATQLLPEIEQDGLLQSLPPTHRPGDLTTLAAAQRIVLPLLLCPSDITEPSFELVEDLDDEGDPHNGLKGLLTDKTRQAPSILIYLPTSNYVGVYGTVEADEFDEHTGPAGVSYGDGSLINDQSVQFADLRRGLSNTLLVGERMMATIPSTWLGVHLRGEDAGCRLAGSAITSPNCDTCDECEFNSRHTGGANFLWADGHVTIVSQFIDQPLYQQSAKRNTR